MKGKWWSSEWFTGVLVAAGFALTLHYDPLTGIEGRFYDLAAGLSAPATIDEGVVVVAVDDIAQESGVGRWQPKQAQRLLELINQGAPRAVALFWPLERTSTPPSLLALGREAEALLQQQPSNDAVPLLQKVAALATDDQRLAGSMRSVDRLLLAVTPTSSWTPQWHWSLRELFTPLPPVMSTTPHIDPLFATAVSGIASDTMMSDASSVVRRIPLHYQQADGTFSPTLPLQLLAFRQQIEPHSLHIAESDGVDVGGKQITTGSGGYFLPRWSRSAARVITASALMHDPSHLMETLRNRVVLAGPLSPALTPMVTLPDGRDVAPVEMAALTLTALAANEAYVISPYAHWAQLGALLFVALLLAGLLPRLSTAVALVTGMVFLGLMINAQLLLLLIHGEWLPLTTPILALAVGIVVLMARRKLTRKLTDVREQLGQVTVALAQQLRHQGQFDEALHHLQQCHIDTACEELYQLGLDYERKRQFNRAEQVFSYLKDQKSRFKDVTDRARINLEARERIVIAGHPSSNMASTLVLEQSELQKPLVGRYQIERELGRGAMGMVYLGHDPKISRTVAIKTVLLAHEHDEKQQEQLRERFFREAESAGRLGHPNIVTIYDVGEEGDLAYIAMDYLPGTSLDHHTSKETLLPVEEVMTIILQVADALDYAHENGVIHRDIKPANII